MGSCAVGNHVSCGTPTARQYLQRRIGDRGTKPGIPRELARYRESEVEELFLPLRSRTLNINIYPPQDDSGTPDL
jgi:hypothetical protein